MRPILCVDIDDTAVTNTVITKVLAKHKLSHVKRHYDLTMMDIPSYVVGEIMEGFSDPEIMSSFEPAPFAVEAVKHAHKIGFEVISITNRYDAIAESTMSMISRHFSPITSIYFTSGQSKAPLMKQLGVRVAVDDSSKVIKECREIKGLDLVMIYNEFTSHNFDFINEGLIPNKVEVIRYMDGLIPILDRIINKKK